MRNLFAIVFVFSSFCACATATEKKSHLSARSQRLKAVHEVLKNDPTDPITQVIFLQEFPKNKDDFKRTFDPQDCKELYDGHEYIEQLTSLSKSHPILVGNILVNLGKDAEHGVDAWSRLQQAVVVYAVEYTKTFVDLLSRYTMDEDDRLIDFLADVENHKIYKEYQQLINNFRDLGEAALTQKLEEARTKRMKGHAH